MNLAGRCRLAVLILMLCTCNGCGTASPEDSATDGTAVAPRQITLKVAVIDDAVLGPVIQRQFGARRNGEIQLTELSWQEFADGDFAVASDNDILIYPMWRLGELASRDLLTPITDDNMPREDSDRRSILRSDRENTIGWGGQEVAVSLGQSHWVMLCRTDVLEEHKLDIPATWKEFSDLAAQLARQTGSDLPQRIAVPLKDHWASAVLFVRAASGIRLPGRYSSFFDVGSMQPLIDTEPFLRSLQGWDTDVIDSAVPQDPEEILLDYASGKIAIAVVPLNARWLDNVDSESLPPTTIVPVPFWSGVYDQPQERWIERRKDDSPIVPLVGSSGMLASTSANSSQLRNSMDFLTWVTEKQISTIVSVESRHAGLSRKSHLGNPAKWLGSSFSAEQARQFANVLTEANESRLRLNSLRIPDASRYLAALDEAIRRVMIEDANSVEELAGVAQTWSLIASESNPEETKANYRRSEGLRR
ncbi:MAG: ABC transporter substrate-binding protein [Pirellulaceae bacterium]